MIKNITAVCVFFLFFNSCAVHEQPLSKKDWYAFTKTSKHSVNPADVYEFADGIIRMHGDNIGYLITHKSYKNFELSLDFR